MKHFKIYYFVFILFFVVACSTGKNTWFSRNYQSFATKYNVQYNAFNTFREACQVLSVANQDDFSEVLSLYPIVNETAVSNISSQMNTTIEKCRKIIKLHSIRVKPIQKPLGMSDKEFRDYRNQEEFNTQVPKAWLLLGKADYYKADFIEAISAFNYILRHYPENKSVVAEARLWILRTYTDMGWLNEAESYLSHIKASDIPFKQQPLYAAFAANLFVRLKRYDEAIPYLKRAIEGAENKFEKTRFNFVLGQLYEKTGNISMAQEHYMLAQRNAHTYEMIFNARLKVMQLEKNSKKAIRGLLKMAKSANNQNYLDQIYYAIGNKYRESDNEVKAIENYKLAIAKSTRNGIDKAMVALTIAELYYNKKNYNYSLQYYDSVLVLMPNTHLKYKTVEIRSQILGELVQNHDIVYLQDSLIRLSYLSEVEQRKIVDKIIKERIEIDKRAAKDSLDREALGVAKANEMPVSLDPISSQQIRSGEWYFYNMVLLGQGKNDFKRKWGNRPLEDNWNRQVKTIAFTDVSDKEQPSEEEQASDSLVVNIPSDPYSHEYYLWQIPKTDGDRQIASKQIATAMYNMGEIFYSKINDIHSADETYREFQRRFPEDTRKAETYFIEYQINGKLSKPEEQDLFRKKLIEEFPASKYAIMLANPDYGQNIRLMLAIQDSLYSVAYIHYVQGNYVEVKNIFQDIILHFPMSDLMPKFSFLSALSSAKMGMKDMFETELDSIVAKYPDADITPVCKDIIALIRQGRSQTVSYEADGIVERRNQEAKEEIAIIRKEVENFTVNVIEGYNMIFIPKKTDNALLNSLLYDIAAYNFGKFMIKDFDFEIRRLGDRDVLLVKGMENMEECHWYNKLIFTDNQFAAKKYISDFRIIIISDSNLSQITSWSSLENYMEFEINNSN